MRRRYHRIRRWLRQRGPRFHRRRFCELHGRRVWVTTRATRSKRRAVFCSPACKAERAHPTKEQAAARVERLRPKCRRPDKKAFDTEAECRSHFAALLKIDPTLGIYECRAGHWHAGHPRRDGEGDAALRVDHRLPPDVVARLRELAEED